MAFVLVMNPGSRAGRGRARWPTWESGLRRAGIDFERIVTRGPDHARAAARAANPGDTIVAVGGDGTINAVLDGILQARRNAVRMGILYAGTSPDFCRFHGIPVDPARALEALLGGRVSSVDAVAIRYTDQAGRTQSAHFGCGCNIGLGASIARHANRWRPYVGDTAGTALSAIRAILAAAPVDLVIDADGRSQSLPRVNNLSVLKNPWIASGLKLNVDLHPCDGRLAWVAIHGLTRLGLGRLLPRFYSGRAVHSPAVAMGRAGAIHIRTADTDAPRRVELEFDGDPRGFLPAAIDILPGALNLIGGGHA